MHLLLRSPRRATRTVFAALMVGLSAALATAAEPAAGPARASALTSTEQTASGLAKLSDEQFAALEAQIQREIALARSGDVVGFSTTFSHRRTAEERAATGLDRLTPEEIVRLDAAVARAVAERPTYPTVYRQASAGTAVALKRRPEIHGEVSFVYGWGSGDREFYGGSVVTHYYDPESKVGITVGLSQLRGNGYWPGYPGYGYYGYPGYYGYYDGYPGYRYGRTGFCPGGPRGRW